jgi:hypothetical protein
LATWWFILRWHTFGLDTEPEIRYTIRLNGDRTSIPSPHAHLAGAVLKKCTKPPKSRRKTVHRLKSEHSGAFELHKKPGFPDSNKAAGALKMHDSLNTVSAVGHLSPANADCRNRTMQRIN